MKPKLITLAGLGSVALAAIPLSAQTTLQLIHASDLEGGLDALNRAANFGAIIEDIEDDYAKTIILSAGDNYIPGPFFSSAGAFSFQSTLENVYEQLWGLSDLDQIEVREGAVDITIMNIIGFDASAVGNHEFDAGTEVFRDLIEEEFDDDAVDVATNLVPGEIEWPGAFFPYLSANLDFSGDAALSGLYEANILPNTDFGFDINDLDKFPKAQEDSKKLAPAVTITRDGEIFGVIGATTQILDDITSAGGVTGTAGSSDDMDALAAVIQPVIDDLELAGVNKIILVSHLQQIALEKQLATLLDGVDVIVAGGSDTLQANVGDILNPGDTADEAYPAQTTDLDGDTVLVVSTDGEYSYVGRLVVNFDASGDVTGFDALSGPIATEAASGIDYAALKTAGTKDDLIQELVDGVQAIISSKDGTVYGETTVFIEGRRSAVRTEETNMGNLTADANLAEAKGIDSTVLVSLKNGGGIRNAIGEIVQVGDETQLLPTAANALSGKLAGQISQLDIENTLRFNNDLTLLTLTATNLLAILEHGVADSAPGNTPGRFPQVAGLSFSFDYNLTPRVRDVAIKDGEGNTLDIIAKDGVIVGDGSREIRVVTLDFIAGGGDGYPYPALATNVVNTAVGEQTALANYLTANHGIAGGTPFSDAEVAPGQDGRIQNLTVRSSTVEFPAVVDPAAPQLSLIGRYETGIFDEGASEIAAFDFGSERLFSTNADAGTVDIISLADPANPVKVDDIDIAAIFGAAGVEAAANSVDVAFGLVVVAVERVDTTVDDQLPGVVAFFDVDGNYITEATVGFLPDMVTFTPNFANVIVANEGEPGDTVDAEGSVSIVSTFQAFVLYRYPAFAAFFGNLQPSVRTVGFSQFNSRKTLFANRGIRFSPSATVAQDLEPEYIAVSSDSRYAYVALQENNAIAVIDIPKARVRNIAPLGTKDWSTLPGLDVSDRDDTINIEPWPVLGIYQPDTIAYVEVNGRKFIATANEGDARGFEEERVKDLTLDTSVFTQSGLQDDEALGRLEISTVYSDIDGNPGVETIYTYGARSFSLFEITRNTRLSLAYDSGSDFEQITAALLPADFNSSNDDNDDFDSRSDAKGPEPEAITTGVVGGKTYVFVGLERIGGIMVYDISDPDAPEFVQYLNSRDFNVDIEIAGDSNPASGDSGVEGLEFVPAALSPSGKDLLIASNEVSGTVAIYTFE